MRRSALVCGMLVGLGACLWAPLSGFANPAVAVSRSDEEFLEKAGRGAQKEVNLGNLARNQAASEKVRDFGALMATDHSKEFDQVKDLATRKGVNLAEGKEASTGNGKLSKLNGADFDRAYMTDMVKDHRKDLKSFQKMATEARDPDIKQFASGLLPTLQEHFEKAVALAKEVGAKVRD